ncbi:MAG: helix-turn-helix domain-containing protein [Chryseolinea sp.]
MTVSTSLLLFVVGVGILQGVFLACLIYFHPSSDRTVNKFLSLYILCYCIPMFTPVVHAFYSWQELILFDPFITLIGPFLFLYVRSFKETITTRKAWPHFIFPILYAFFNFYLYRTFVNEFPDTKVFPAEIPHRPIMIFRVLLRISQMIIYFFLASRALTIHQRSIQHLFSETSKINLSWVRWLINGYMALLLLMISLYVLILQNPDRFALIILINTALVTPYLYAVSFRGITQPMLWQLKHGLSKDVVEVEIREAEEIEQELPTSTRNQKVTISPDKRDQITSGILRLMEEERLFLQSELTLQDLADSLATPSYQVTQALNDGIKKNFYDLVNGYRVEEAKRMLIDPANKNSKILTVGLEAGFNSKTTFNTVFKKFTGFTPSEFKDQHPVALAQN